MIRFPGTERATDRTKVYLGEAWQKNTCHRLFRFAFAALIIGALFSCGGGSGDETPSGSPDGAGQITGGDKDIYLSSDSVAFFYTPSGPDPAPQTLTASFSGDGLLIGYPPGVEEPSWLLVEQVDETDTSSPVEIRLTAYPHLLGDQSVQTTVRFVTGNLDGSDASYRDLSVSCSAQGQIALDQTEVSFSHINGAAPPAPRSVTVLGADFTWTASSDQSWVVLAPASGTAPGALNIGIAPQGLETGAYSATVTVKNISNGDSSEVTVNLAVEPHKLFIGDNGVAFASFPSAPSVLSHTVTVSENAAVLTPWEANSDQPWLSVTPSGTTDGPLTLSADPTGLASDTIHYARVTVSSNDATIETAEPMEVGFYVASSDPSVSELPIAGGYIASDPIRPYVYVTYGDSLLSIFNIYTGEEAGRLSAGAELKAMTTSTNGETLFIADGGDQTIVPVDLETLNIGMKWPAESFVQVYPMLEYARFNGQDVVMTNRREVFDADSGTLVATIPYPTNETNLLIAPSQDRKSFFSARPWVSGYTHLVRYTGDYSTVYKRFSVTQTESLLYSFNNVKDIAANRDGSKLYLADGGSASFRIFIYDGSALVPDKALPARAYPAAVELSPTEDLYGGAFTIYDPIDAWGYGISDSVENTYSINGSLYERQLRISGDGLRMVTLSDAPALTFTPITP